MTQRFSRVKSMSALCLTGVILSACVSHTWAPGPGATGNLAQVGGQCQLLAKSAGQQPEYVSAYGQPAFVGAMVGTGILLNAIGSAITQNEVFNACLLANGFVPVDGAPQ
jgi:hypothetical protein